MEMSEAARGGLLVCTHDNVESMGKENQNEKEKNNKKETHKRTRNKVR